MEVAWIGVAGVVIGAVITGAIALATNWWTLRHQIKQWERQKKVDEEQQLKARLQEIYSNCLLYL